MYFIENQMYCVYLAFSKTGIRDRTAVGAWDDEKILIMKFIFIYTKPSFNALNVHTVASNTEHISSVLSHTGVRFSTKCAKLKGSPEIKA